MTPYQRIAREYAKRPEAESFEWYVRWHHNFGFVFSTPDYFIMGVPAARADLLAGRSPMEPSSAAPDCWYFSAMAGDMSRAWACLPWPLGYVAFHRDRAGGKELTITPTERLRRLSAPDALCRSSISPS